MNEFTIEHENKITLIGRFNKFREKYKVQSYATIAVIITIALLLGQILPTVKKYISDSGLLNYIILLVLLDLSSSVYLYKRSSSIITTKNQDEGMPKLISEISKYKCNSADLLEYAGMTTLSLIRELCRKNIEVRILVKHPDTISGIQKSRMISTLDSLYNSIFKDYSGSFEVRCYKLPHSLRGRRIGTDLLELGWLTPDYKNESAFGHTNPSVQIDLTFNYNNHFLVFFNKTFDDLWNHKETEDGLVVFNKFKPT